MTHFGGLFDDWAPDNFGCYMGQGYCYPRRLIRERVVQVTVLDWEIVQPEQCFVLRCRP